MSQREARRARGRTKTPRKLVVVDGGGGKPGTIRLEEALQVGRAEGCQIRLGDTYISQFHARLFPRDGTWYIEDLELGGKARTRWPGLTSAASDPVSTASRTFPDLRMVPAVRIQFWTGRAETELKVSVSASA